MIMFHVNFITELAFGCKVVFYMYLFVFVRHGVVLRSGNELILKLIEYFLKYIANLRSSIFLRTFKGTIVTNALQCIMKKLLRYAPGMPGEPLNLTSKVSI